MTIQAMIETIIKTSKHTEEMEERCKFQFYSV